MSFMIAPRRLLRYKIHSMYGYLRVSFPSSGNIRGEQSMPEGSRYKVLSYCSAALVLAMVAATVPAIAQFPPAPDDQPAAKGKRGGAAAAPSINGNWSGQLTQVAAKRLTSSSSRSAPRERRRSTPISTAPGSSAAWD